MLLEAKSVTRSFGAFVALSDASLALDQGDMVGLIGPNGAHSSTASPATWRRRAAKWSSMERT
jgi:ABC-type branched-subunit amino acid transport system ATPase component